MGSDQMKRLRNSYHRRPRIIVDKQSTPSSDVHVALDSDPRLYDHSPLTPFPPSSLPRPPLLSLPRLSLLLPPTRPPIRHRGRWAVTRVFAPYPPPSCPSGSLALADDASRAPVQRTVAAASRAVMRSEWEDGQHRSRRRLCSRRRRRRPLLSCSPGRRPPPGPLPPPRRFMGRDTQRFPAVRFFRLRRIRDNFTQAKQISCTKYPSNPTAPTLISREMANHCFPNFLY